MLVIMAEYEGLSCLDTIPNWNQTTDTVINRCITSTWQPDAANNGVMPNIDIWFDPFLSANPQGKITKYFEEASFGAYHVLGDYYPDLISVPYGSSRDMVLQKLQDRHALSSHPDYIGPFISKAGLSVNDFDLWADEIGSDGLAKSNIPNGTIDCITILWRNRSGGDINCGAGYGHQPLPPSQPIYIGTKTTNMLGEWSSCSSVDWGMFVLEYIHAIFGHNNWHSGSGAATHTFPFATGSYSMTAQNQSASNRVSGWDRFMLDYKNPNKPQNFETINAEKEGTGLVQTDYSIADISSTNNTVFILRDFYKTGDCIRLQLPHINRTTDGVGSKNQYMWLENRQGLSEFDKAKWEDKPCKDPLNSGLYAYIQVGKDRKHGGSLYPYDWAPQYSNALGSWLFPLTAEGNYDFHFRYDLKGKYPGNCSWNNGILPIEKQDSMTLPNPFTGMSDLYRYDDVDGNGTLYSVGDRYVTDWGLGEVINGNLEFNAHGKGDSEDAFRFGINDKIGIGRNPAPTPVYTYRSGYNLSSSNTNPNQVTQSYENRTIYLNGISIEIIEEIWNPTLAANDLKVKIRWDDYVVDQDTRWCGNIVLQNDVNDPNGTQSQVIIDVDKKVTLDQGRSATRHTSVTLPDGVTKAFIKPTEMTLKAGTKLHLLENSTLELNQYSTLIVEDGAEIVLEENACIVVNESTKLLLKSENIQLNGNNAKIIVKGDIETADGVDVTFTGDGFFEFHPTHSFTMGTNSIVSFEGSSINDEVLVLKEDTELNLESNITIRTGKVVYEANSSIYANNKEVRFIMCTLAATPNSSPSATGIRTIDAEKLYMVDCVVDYLEKGIDAKSVAYTEGHYLIEDNTFQNNTTGLYFEGADKLQFYRNHLKFNDVCVDLKDVDYIYSNNNLIDDVNIKGYNLDDVRFLYMNGDEVKDCQYGIYGVSSNAFLRGHTEITNNQYGVYMDNIMPDYALTVGDLSCGLIYDNYIAGVAGKNIILNIDAEIHACTRGDCSTLTPNTFHNDNVGNGAKLFDICYKLYSVDNTILAKGNYWANSGQGAGFNYDVGYIKYRKCFY
jgi:hypothetical protein